MNALLDMFKKRQPSLYTEGSSQAPQGGYGSQAANTIRQSPMQANEPADLYGLQMAEQSELSDRMFQNERLGNTNELKALKGLFMRKNDEIRQGTVERQRPQVEARMAELASANSQGYSGVNATGDMHAYNRGINERKINAPIEAARTAGQYDVRQSEAAARGTADVARIQGENSLRNTELQQQGAREYRDWASQTPGPDASFNPKTGAMGATPRGATPNLNPLLNPFHISQGNLGGVDPWDEKNASLPVVQEHRSRWQGLLMQHPAGDDVKSDVMKVLANPNLRNRQVEELLDMEQDDPSYVQEMRELLALARGGR